VAYAIDTDAHQVGDPYHTQAHNNIADMLGLLANVLAQQGGPVAAFGIPPAGNTAAVAALQAMQAWAYAGYCPWQFPVSAYGAKGNGKIITDATMTSGQNLLNSAAQAQFSTADIGKSVLVSCAGGGAYSPLGSTTSGGACTITAVNSATQAVLSVNASSTTAGASICCYGNDDTAAIRATVAAAVAYAQSPANQGTYAEVLFNSVLYCVAGAAVIGGATLGNAQIPLPVINPVTEKVVLAFTASTKAMDQSLMHWDQLVPQSSGPVLACLRTDGTNDATYGPASVIGGPFNGYGGDLGLFSNMMPSVDGIMLMLPYNSTFGAWDFFGMAEAFIPNFSAMTMAVVNYGATSSPPFPNISNCNNITNTWTFGVRMPCTGNNDRCDMTYGSVEGLCYGYMPSEHSSSDTFRGIYCIIGIESYSGNGVAMPHSGRIQYASVEGCANTLGFMDGIVNIDVDTIDSETSSCIVYDPSNRGVGTIYLRSAGGSPAFVTNLGGVQNGATGCRIIALDNVVFIGPRTGPAAPANNTALANGYYRDATIYMSATTGITAVKVDSTTTGMTAAANVVIPVRVPSAHSFTVTYTGTLTTLWVPE
jgi:hypothetical protein